jgi:hypothetical protein
MMNGKCVIKPKKCTAYTNKKDCNYNNNCYWNKDNKCAAQCNIIKKEDCNNASNKFNNSNCISQDKKCRIQNCSIYTNMDLCKKIHGCTPSKKNKCIEDCSLNNNNKKLCDSSNNCDFNGDRNCVPKIK